MKNLVELHTSMEALHLNHLDKLPQGCLKYTLCTECNQINPQYSVRTAASLKLENLQEIHKASIFSAL